MWTGRLRRSIRLLKEVVSVNNRDQYAYFALGAAYLSGDNKDLAMEQYKILNDLNPVVAKQLYEMIERK